MKVKIDGFEHECSSAERILDHITLTKTASSGKQYITRIAGQSIVQNAVVIEGEWSYDAYAKPSQLDVIEAQVTYTAMMTDTLLEV